MIKKHTICKIADNCGVFTGFVFHLYKGFNRKSSYFGDYVKISVRDTKPNNWLVKKTKTKALLFRTKKETMVCDGTYCNFNTNSLITLKRRLTTNGDSIQGPCLRTFKKKKFLNSLSGCL